MSTPSEMVQNRLNTGAKVIAAARTHGPKIAAAVAERAILAQGPTSTITPESVLAIIHGLADILDHAGATLRARELEYTAEQADDSPVRQARDAAVEQALNVVVRLRAAVENNLGRASLKLYGLHKETPRTPRTLLTHLENVSRLLTKSPAKVDGDFGASFDSATAAASLKARHAELEAHINDDDREARELEDALTLRNRATAEWTDAYQGLASALEGFFRIAGWRELAERVRPTTRTSRGEEVAPDIENAEPAPEPAPEPAAGKRG